MQRRHPQDQNVQSFLLHLPLPPPQTGQVLQNFKTTEMTLALLRENLSLSRWELYIFLFAARKTQVFTGICDLLKEIGSELQQKEKSKLMLWVPDHLQKKAFPKPRRETFSSACEDQEL